MEDPCFEDGEMVQVEIADDIWVEARVVPGTETRYRVELLTPVIRVNIVSTVTKSFFGLRTKVHTDKSSRLVQSMTFGVGSGHIRRKILP